MSINNLTLVNINNKKDFYIALNYCYSLNKNKILIIDLSKISFLSNIVKEIDNDILDNKNELFKIKVKKLVKNLDYINIKYLSNIKDIINFYFSKYENIIIFADKNSCELLNSYNKKNIFFIDDNSKLNEDFLISSIKNNDEIIIYIYSFDLNNNDKLKKNILFQKKYEKYILQNFIPYPLYNFNEKPYIINKKFFDEKIVKIFGN